MAICYGGAVINDWIILCLSIRSIREKENSLPNSQPHAGGEMGRLGDEADPRSLQQPSTLSYGQPPLSQRGMLGSSSSASGIPVTEKTDPSLDPEAGRPDHGS